MSLAPKNLLRLFTVRTVILRVLPKKSDQVFESYGHGRALNG
jgi:hypothetical protein